MTAAAHNCSACNRKVCTEADRNTDGAYTCRACLYLHSARPGGPDPTADPAPKAPA